jgi:hypothetical protein
MNVARPGICTTAVAGKSLSWPRLRPGFVLNGRSTEELIVSRFGGRMIAVLAVWLGLAMLGYGPRANASFLPFATDLPQSSCGAEPENAGSGPSELQKQRDSLPTSDAIGVLPPNDCGAQRSTGSSGAGSTSSVSSGPFSLSFMPVSREDLFGQGLMTHLRSLEGFLLPDPHTAAILEPPRAG